QATNRHAKVADRSADVVKPLSRYLVRLSVAEERDGTDAETHGLLAEDHIADGIEIFAQGQILVYGLNTVLPRRSWRQVGDLFLTQPECPRVRLMNAAQDLHQGAFAGAVVADQTEHF